MSGVQPDMVNSIVRNAEEHGATVVRTHSALVVVYPLEAKTEAPKRIPIADVVSHGAPSVAWVQARARRGEIQITGPRGARTVDSDELASLLASTTIKRRSRVEPHPVATADVVADLAARRARRAS